MKKIIYLFLFLSVISNSFAQDNHTNGPGSDGKDEFKPEVKIGGKIFTGWEFNMDNANFISKVDTTMPDSNAAFGFAPTKNQFEVSQNSFYFERAYINVLASLTPTIKGRITPDVYSFTDGGGKTQFALQLKYAWLDWTALQLASGLNLDLVLGIMPNQWIDLNEKYFGYRGFIKVLSDYPWTVSAVKGTGNTVTRTTGTYFSSADLGANLTVTAPKGMGELYINAFNGNGFRNLSFDNRFKDVEAVAFVHPLSKQIKDKMDRAKKNGKDRITGVTDLTVGGFAYVGKLGLGENYTPKGVQYKRNRFGGMLNFRFNFKKAGFLHIGGEYSMQKNQDPSSSKPDSASNVTASGLSAYLEFNPPVVSVNEKVMLLARYDMFDPNNANTNSNTITFNDNTDKQTLLLLGLAYKPNKVLTFGVTYQQIGYQIPFIVKYDGTTSKTDSKLVMHGVLEF